MTSKSKDAEIIETGTELLGEIKEVVDEAEKAGTLKVEQGSSQEIDFSYDMAEVLHNNILEHLEQAKRIAPMLQSTKSTRRVLMKLLYQGMRDDKEADMEAKIRLQGDLEKNFYELCKNIESDKRGLALQAYSAALANLPNEIEKQAKELEEQKNNSQGEE